MKGIFKPRPILRALRPWIIVCCLMLCGFVARTTAQADCPADKVCITRDAALKAIHDDDQVKADAVAIAGYKQAIDDLKAELNKMRVEFAAMSGENTALKQNAVSDRAIIDILIKQVRPKKIGLINF